MNTALWVVQILLAAIFALAGFVKATKPKQELYTMGMKYVEDFSQGQMRAIGVVEVLGAIGLILPWALNILPVLTPLAAAGLALTMVGAIYTHVRRGETEPKLIMNVVLLAMSVFVAWGRFTGAV